MKKIFVLFAVGLLTFSFAACGPSAPDAEVPALELDIFSIYDRETGAIFRLGDHISVIEEAFGPGREFDWAPPPPLHLFWADFSVTVVNETVARFSADPDRFMFAAASFDITSEELERDFEEIGSSQFEHGLWQTFQRYDYLGGVLVSTIVFATDGVIDGFVLRHETMLEEFEASREELPLELDALSVLDTETGLIFSLGDERAVFEEALGPSDEFSPEHHGFTSFVYVVGRSEDLMVHFLDDIAFWMHTNSERFVFAEASFDMEIERLRERFIEVDDPYAEEGHATFRRRYDQNGTLTEDSDSTVVHLTVSTRDEVPVFISLMDVDQFREWGTRGSEAE